MNRARWGLQSQQTQGLRINHSTCHSCATCSEQGLPESPWVKSKCSAKPKVPECVDQGNEPTTSPGMLTCLERMKFHHSCKPVCCTVTQQFGFAVRPSNLPAVVVCAGQRATPVWSAAGATVEALAPPEKAACTPSAAAALKPAAQLLSLIHI